jgi:hypothetical protein
MVWTTASAGLLVWLTGSAVAAAPQVNGKLEKIGPLRVLRVWGTPEEMGFAHGYLVGAEYIDYLERRIADLSPVQRASREMIRERLADVIRIPDRAQRELDGLLKGIEAARGGKTRIDALNRRLSIDDLGSHNAGDTLRALASCSGFTVWGDVAGEAGVITTRNFDFPMRSRETLATQFILVRRPKGRRRTATITFPAYIGAFTGINEDGVCTFMHDGSGGMKRTLQGPYTPVALLLTELLESSRPANAHARAESMLKGVVPYPVSYMIRVITPRVPGKVDTPVRVFRVDGSGFAENVLGDFASITTNHYLGAGLTPATNAGESSLSRYETLEKRLGATVTRQSAWDALRSVASSNLSYPTLHSLVVYPEQRRLDLAFGDWKDTFVPAPDRNPTAISFDKLFAPHD